MKWSNCLWIPACLVVLTGGCRSASDSASRTPSDRELSGPAFALSAGRTQYRFSAEDEVFLDDLERRIVDYFWREIYPETGLVIDHTENRTGKVAATGFGLAAICIGVERGWIPYDAAYERVWKTLNTFWDGPQDPDDIAAEGKFGLFWHFVDGRTGKMKPVDCVAMCDSADLIAGALIAGEYFKGIPIETLARAIYDNVQWDEFVSHRSDGSAGLLSFGWVPFNVSESYYDIDGVLPFNMSGLVDNSLLIYALALGSGTHPIPQATWDEYVDSCTIDDYAGYEAVFAGALFVRQVPQGFIPFQRKRDRKIEYFLDTVNALLADRVFNMRENGYPPQVWGLNDCFGKDTYSHAAPPGMVMNDGTIGCCSFEGALAHVPELSMQAMRYVKEQYGDRVYGKYGFTSSMNLQTDFFSPRFVGIELGPALLLMENARSGLIWDLFGRTEVMKTFVRRARMCGVIDDFEMPPEAPPYAEWSAEGARLAIAHGDAQHGRAFLDIRAEGKPVTLLAELPENDLLDYDFSRVLSLWARDAAVGEVSARLSGRWVQLSRVGEIEGSGWMHAYFQLPDVTEEDEMQGLRIGLTCTGERPALDNLTLEREADLGVPGRITDLRAVEGKHGGTIRMEWTTPADAGSDRIASYLLNLHSKAGGPDDLMNLSGVGEPGSKEDRLVLLESGETYRLSVAAVDENGHRGPESDIVEVTANAGQLGTVIDDFHGDDLSGWETESVGPIVLTPSDNGEGGRCMGVTFQKTHGWNWFSVKIDPEMLAIHRYIDVRVRGDVQLLAKMWCSEQLQGDIEVQDTDGQPGWIVLRFDTHRVAEIAPSRDSVQKILFFPSPGDWTGKGQFEIDWVKYAKYDGRIMPVRAFVRGARFLSAVPRRELRMS